MATTLEQDRPQLAAGRTWASKGLVTIGTATVILFVLSALLDRASVSGTSLSGMLPIAAVLAIAGLGQMLVVQQGGIDLSVPGAISLALVVITHVPDGDSSKLGVAVLIALVLAVAAGALNGLLIGTMGLNPIIATLGANAVLYGVNLQISGGRPRITTRLMGDIGGGSTLGVPNSVFFAIATLGLVTLVVKRTVAGRRFEAIGANQRAARAAGLRVRTHRTATYVWAQLLYCLAGILVAGITSQPTAFAGDTFLLPSIAVVVLGGTSLLGGRGFPLPTVIAAVFLQQLVQLVTVLGFSAAISPLVQAAALAVGVSLYTIDWRSILARRPRPPAAAGAPAAGTG
ncbi:ABC transporter permease [Nocardioides mangrovicus]|uniref:Autoinducer 2 import system permease protein LsrD n=1 Tax=Nocardioides mangrovicus TaxID=2478913 RepID=A0A3L8NYL2_9ACTN|nr:ABC transporter permease [Nocardioides mangrovicus]RLV47974.1 ABC transporter permease [Nocardioides mangrovicus]